MRKSTMFSTAYSKTPLAKKLGIKAGYHIKLINAPIYYFDLFIDLPTDLCINKSIKYKKNFIHFFTKDGEELVKILPQLKTEILRDGLIWVSWPKKSGNIATTVTENMIRDIAINNGLVDIKVCAVEVLGRV